MSLHDKCALIPGASRPIGRAIAKKFAVAGASLILPVFDWPESISEMEKEFTESGFNFSIISVDLRDKSNVIDLAEDIKKEYGSIDYLINNIERGGMPIVHGSYDLEHNDNQWDIEFETTLKAKWLLYHHCAPLMIKRKGASIVNISSISGITGRSGPAALLFNDGYSAANCAVRSFTKNWAKELAPTVRVNELMLGLIMYRHGEKTRGWGVLSAPEKKNLLNTILLGRTGTPEEVADTAFFMAVDASYITGTTIIMDGGFTLGGQNVPTIPSGILD